MADSDAGEMKAAYREVARRGIDMLLEHARLCPLCLLYGVDRCKLGDAMRRVIEKGCELGLAKKRDFLERFDT